MVDPVATVPDISSSLHTNERTQYSRQAPHVILYSTVGASLVTQVAQAVKCLAHRLVEGVGGRDAEFDVNLCTLAR